MTVSTLTQPHRAGRAGFAAFGALLLASAALEATTRDGVAWQIAAFGLGPDVALLLGAARGLARGQLRPRAVPVYNLLHRFPIPLALGGLAVAAVVPSGYIVGALAWGAHIA